MSDNEDNEKEKTDTGDKEKSKEKKHRKKKKKGQKKEKKIPWYLMEEIEKEKAEKAAAEKAAEEERIRMIEYQKWFDSLSEKEKEKVEVQKAVQEKKNVWKQFQEQQEAEEERRKLQEQHAELQKQRRAQYLQQRKHQKEEGVQEEYGNVLILKCKTCNLAAYSNEQIVVGQDVFHKLGCFKCIFCNMPLKLWNYKVLEGRYYCVPHYNQFNQKLTNAAQQEIKMKALQAENEREAKRKEEEDRERLLSLAEAEKKKKEDEENEKRKQELIKKREQLRVEAEETRKKLAERQAGGGKSDEKKPEQKTENDPNDKQQQEQQQQQQQQQQTEDDSNPEKSEPKPEEKKDKKDETKEKGKKKGKSNDDDENGDESDDADDDDAGDSSDDESNEESEEEDEEKPKERKKEKGAATSTDENKKKSKSQLTTDSEEVINFFNAVKAGDEQTILSMLEKGTSINIVNSQGETALHWAVMWKKPKMVSLLLSKGADVMIKTLSSGSTPLHCLCGSTPPETDTSLPQEEKDELQKEEEEIVKFLLEDPRMLIDSTDMNLNTPLILASAQGRVNTVKALIKNKAAVGPRNKLGATCLHAAADSGMVEVAKQLMNVEQMDVNMQDEQGYTPLHLAVMGNHVGFTRLLLALGANTTLEDKFHGRSPLDEAKLKSAEMRKLFEMLASHRPGGGRSHSISGPPPTIIPSLSVTGSYITRESGPFLSPRSGKSSFKSKFHLFASTRVESNSGGGSLPPSPPTERVTEDEKRRHKKSMDDINDPETVKQAKALGIDISNKSPKNAKTRLKLFGGGSLRLRPTEQPQTSDPFPGIRFRQNQPAPSQTSNNQTPSSSPKATQTSTSPK